MRVLARNPAPSQLRQVEVDPSALEGATVEGVAGSEGSRENPGPGTGMSASLSERVLGGSGGQSGQSQTRSNDSSQNTRSNPASLSEMAEEAPNAQMPESSTRENPDAVTDVNAQIQNAGQVFLPALAVETGSRASTLITGGVATSSFVGSGTFQKVVEVSLPVVLGIATFMIGERMDNVYIKQSAVGMAIPAADALLNPILSPVESALGGQPAGGGNGGGNGQQGMAAPRGGMGYGEFMTEEDQMGMGSAVPANRQLSGQSDGMGIDRSTDLVEESQEGSRFAKVSVDE